MRSCLIFPIVLGLASVACSGPFTTITRIDNETRYDPGTVVWASQDGELAAVVRGNPFPGGAADEAIAAALSLPGWLPPARITIMPADRSRSGHRLVLVFNPAREPLGGKAACGDLSAVLTNEAGAMMRVQLAFCSGAEVDAEATLQAPAGRTPRDPVFRQALDDALEAMLPPANRSHSLSLISFPPAPRPPAPGVCK